MALNALYQSAFDLDGLASMRGVTTPVVHLGVHPVGLDARLARCGRGIVRILS